MEGRKRPRVAILTTLCDFSPAYSLVGIILDQARMLQKHGYDYTLFCLKNFNKRDRAAVEPEKLGIAYTLAQTVLHCYKPNEKPRPDHVTPDGDKVLAFDEQVRIHVEGDDSGIGYYEALEPYDVVITHDLMYLDWYLVQNAAVRKCIERWPGKRWIHWVHSGAGERPDVNEENPRANEICYPTTLRYSAAPNSTYVFLNMAHRQELANMLDADNSAIECVYNPKDVRDVYRFRPETRLLIDRYGLMRHQVLQVYPFSTPRWDAKGVPHLMTIFANLRRMGVDARLVLVNAHCNRDVNKPQLDAMEAYAKKVGLRLDEDVVFTSRFGQEMADKVMEIARQLAKEKRVPEKDAKKRESADWALWKYSVPYGTVTDLMLLANLFIFPSESECCSLIQAEASIAGKFMVLNRDFLPMLEFCAPGVLHYEFNVNDPDDNPAYYEAVAREIWANMQHEASVMNATLARTRTYNPDWIFRMQFEPLLYVGFPEKASSAARPEAPPPPPLPPAADPRAGEPAPPPDFANPQPGMPCPIFGRCEPAQKARCVEQAGHCLVLDGGPRAPEAE